MTPLIEELQEVVGKRGYVISDVDFTKGDRLVIGIKESKNSVNNDPRQLELELEKAR